MKFIIVPEPVTLFNMSGSRVQREEGGDEPPWPMLEFLRRWVLADIQWGKSGTMTRASARIEAAFEGAQPGDVVDLADEDHKRLRAIAEDPSHPYNPVIVKQCVRFLDAIDEAKSTRPLREDQVVRELPASKG